LSLRAVVVGGREEWTAIKLSLMASGTIVVRYHCCPNFEDHPSSIALRVCMELIFRETLPSDVEGLFSVRGRTRENPISKDDFASLGITAEARNLAVTKDRPYTPSATPLSESVSSRPLLVSQQIQMVATKQPFDACACRNLCAVAEGGERRVFIQLR